MKDIRQILDKLSIEMNAMQQEAQHAILHSGNDVVVLSPTGSGKTLSYLLPLVQLVDAEDDCPQAVVIVPGRELALQSCEVLKSMGAGVRAMACYGGRPTMDEHRTMKSVRPQILFGTPGRLNDHIDKSNFPTDHIKFVVIDEFDKCLEMGFHDEMQALIGRLPMDARRILLSATDAAEIPSFMSKSSRRRTERVDFLDDGEQVPDRVTVYKVVSPVKDKLDTLRRLLLDLGDESSIVFLNYRDSVQRTDDYLRSEGFSTSAFHGGMEQKQREDALYKFANASANVFVSTDLASRGLDIENVGNIIHYHLPKSEDVYIHRVGRTARWDKQGKAFFILNSEERIPDYVDAEVEEYHISDDNKPVPVPKMSTIYIGKGKKDKISKGDIVGFLCKKGGLEMKEIGKIDVNERFCYVAISRKKLKQVLRQTSGEKIKGVKTVVEPVG